MIVLFEFICSLISLPIYLFMYIDVFIYLFFFFFLGGGDWAWLDWKHIIFKEF